LYHRAVEAMTVGKFRARFFLLRRYYKKEAALNLVH